MERKIDVEDTATLKQLLLKGRNRTDIGRKVIEELGFSVALWNGARKYEDEAGVMVCCGAYCQVAGLPTPNSVSVSFPIELREFADWRRMRKIMSFTAEAWEPDFLTVYSNNASDSREFTYPFVDWMLYVSDVKYKVPETIPAAHVERLDKLGTIIVVQEAPPDPENEEHNRNIERVRVALGL